MNGEFDITPFLAGRAKRFLAYLIDVLPISIITFLIFYFYLGFDQLMETYVANPEDLDMREDFIIQRDWISRVSFSVWIFYCAIMESSPYQATVGKMAMKMKVVDEFGEPLTPMKSGIRNLSKIISMIVFSIGFLWILIDRKNQGWHDKIARTYVVDQLLFEGAKTESTEESEGGEISDLE